MIGLVFAEARELRNAAAYSSGGRNQEHDLRIQNKTGARLKPEDQPAHNQEDGIRDTQPARGDAQGHHNREQREYQFNRVKHRQRLLSAKRDG